MAAACAPYLVVRSGAVLAAWRATGAHVVADVDDALGQAAVAASTRTVAALRALLATDPVELRATPLEILRTCVREPTAVLSDAGVPHVERDDFARRSFPDDAYDMAPRTLADLDEDLGPVLLAWGLAKARVLARSR